VTAQASTPLVVDALDVIEGRTLGRGGQGRVTEVTVGVVRYTEPLVAKWYLPQVPVDAAALTRLVSWRRDLPAAQQRRLDEQTCWPRAVLVGNQRVVGVLLPRVADGYAFTSRLPSGDTATALRELQFLVADATTLARRRLPDVSLDGRLRVLRAFADGVAFLHRDQIVLGDLSVKNVLWSLAGTTYLLDCDALRLVGTQPPTPQANSPGWEDPLFPGTQSQLSDRYKLALAVLRVLARDFQTRNPDAARPVLGDRLADMLRSALRGRPEHRPTAADWSTALSNCTTETTDTKR
jgi:hypothetical protein